MRQMGLHMGMVIKRARHLRHCPQMRQSPHSDMFYEFVGSVMSELSGQSFISRSLESCLMTGAKMTNTRPIYARGY